MKGYAEDHWEEMADAKKRYRESSQGQATQARAERKRSTEPRPRWYEWLEVDSDGQHYYMDAAREMFSGDRRSLFYLGFKLWQRDQKGS
jgi:hypothetical protein